jgi:hypothetical protein
MTTVRACPVCSHSDVLIFLSRSQVPAHQHHLCDTPEAARNVVKADLRLGCCRVCGFVFNSAFDPSKLDYGSSYDNNQEHSLAFKAYTVDLVRYLVDEKGLVNTRIVEVGCGQGAFLKALVDANPGNIGHGFDPSCKAVGGANPRMTFHREFYGRGSTAIAADAVVCRHVIEHVAEPLELLGAVRAALADSPRARVFFETPCLEWILRNHVIWDFFYEHCSYFTAASLREAFRRSGFRVEKIAHVFSGQYLWLEASIGDDIEAPPRDAIALTALAQAYSAQEAHVFESWNARVRDLRREGAVAVWGAGAKGVTFVNLLDPRCEIVDCVVDLNPAKQGRFLPGSGHPIVSFQALKDRGIRSAVLMNPNYRNENLSLLRGANLDVDLIDG